MTSGRPASSIVGTSGRPEKRRDPVMAIPRNAPDCTCGATVAAFRTLACTVPCTMAVIAGAPPGKGTCVALVPVRCMNSSMPRCSVLPMPPEL